MPLNTYREELAAGKIGWADVTPPEWLPADESAIAVALAGDGTSVPYEKEYTRKDGTRVPVIVGFALYEKEETVAFILDNSERKRAEAALTEADRRKDEFLAMLAHELRNPLAAIANASTLIRGDKVPAEIVRWSHQVIERQVGQLRRLIDDLLDVSRISHGKIQLRREHIDAIDIVKRAVDSTRAFAEERRHEMVISPTTQPMPLYVDATRLEQVITNLLNNAAKYTEKGGRITVMAEPVGAEVIIRVRDNGVGIPSEMLPYVFKLFTQVNTSLDREQGGLGIGLSLVRALTEMHGGTVTVASEGPGLGTEVTVRIPRVIDPYTANPALASPDMKPGIPRRLDCRILVVDDNADHLWCLSWLIESMGHKVFTAEDGTTGLALAREHRPEIVILDLGLPRLSGYEVARTIRAELPSDVLLIAVSGYFYCN